MTPRESIREARRGVHRQHLLDAAERVFAERGYDRTRMQDVAAEAGLALATVYDLIRRKEDLYAEIHRVRGDALLQRAAQTAAGAKDAMDALLVGVRAYAEFLLEHPHYLRIQLQESQPWAVAPRFTTTEQDQKWRQGLELATRVFEAAIVEGRIRREDPALLARLMIAAHQVYLGDWMEQGMKEPATELVARMQEHVRRAFGA